MHVPRYWETESTKVTAPDGRTIETSCWGWSETSREEARERAMKAAKRLAGRLVGGDQLPSHYGYDERLPREEIVDEMTDRGGETRAFVSRNAYGCLVLNTRDLMFIDIDFPPARPSVPLPGFLRKLFKQPPPVSPSETIAEKIRTTAQANPGLTFRVYRTQNGFRVMISSRPVRAESDEAKRLLEAFDADPLYRRMCKNQDCFRARLTPKVWRCDVAKPPARFPFASSGEEATYRKWESEYSQAIAGYSTCKYVETLGDEVSDPSLEDLIELHDNLTKASSSDPLA